MWSRFPCYSQDNGLYIMHIVLKAGGDNEERIGHQRSPRPTARARNRKRKASATRNTTQDSAQPVRKRARTALQYEHYYHDDPDNDDVHEILPGTLPPSPSGADYARCDVEHSYLSTSQPLSYTAWKIPHVERHSNGSDFSLQSNIGQLNITNRNTCDMRVEMEKTIETRNYRKNTRTKNTFMNWNTRTDHKTT